MRTNALLRYGLLTLIALPMGLLLLHPQLLRCLFIENSTHFLKLAGTPNTYIGRTATPRQVNTFQQNIKTAEARIRRFWGDKRGTATLIYCPTQARYEQYCDGGEGAGCSLGMPWGTTYLILGPDGNEADVIAHEFCHNELFARLGWWRVKRQIPQWFNEGLALMVDYRFVSPSVWEQPDSLSVPGGLPGEDKLLQLPQRPMLKLAELETTRDFFGGDYTHTLLAYQTAADELTRWLTSVGRSGVPELADALANGQEFDVAYRQLERRKRGGNNH